MKICFLGTRGEIKAKTRRHHRHTSTLISYRNKHVMIDCGDDWRKKVFKIHPDAIVITHAHPDHAFGLDEGSPCPVFATQVTWEKIKKYPIEEEKKCVIKPRKPKKICGITFEAFPVIHSILAPAVGYRITAGKNSIFYVPDVVWIENRGEAFRGIKAYIGDGATLKRNMVRKAKATSELIGHAHVSGQITWCQKEKVPLFIITHCGSDIVMGDEKKILKSLKTLGKEKDVYIKIAHDGLTLNL